MLDRAAAMRQPMLSYDEEHRLIAQWKATRSEESRDALVASHMRICYALAARWTQNEAQVADLAQEGFFGLLKALDKFDPERGKRFGPYAKWWIKTSVEESLGDVLLAVDMPSRVYRRARKAEPPPGAAPSAVPSASWEARAAARGEVSLDAPVGDGEDSLVDMLEDGRNSPEDDAIESDRAAAIRKSIESALAGAMSPREAEVLRRRDLAEHPETLEGIAASLGVSRERVRQIQNAALGKLRRWLVHNKFPVHLLRGDD